MSDLIGSVPPQYGSPGAIPAYRPAFQPQGGDPLTGALMTQGGMLLEQAMLRGGGMAAQLFPQQSFYDQVTARRYYESQMVAMQGGLAHDTRRMTDMLTGIGRAAGFQVTPQLLQTNEQLAKASMSLLPSAVQMLGAANVDAVFGRNGSAVAMAYTARPALYYRPDPVTGYAHGSGQSAAFQTSEMFAGLYGPGSDPSRMRGLGAASSGELLTAMNQRGILAAPIGMLTSAQRLAAIHGNPNFLANGRDERIAMQTVNSPEISGDLLRQLQTAGAAGLAGDPSLRAQADALTRRARAAATGSLSSGRITELARTLLSPDEQNDPGALARAESQVRNTQRALATADATTIAGLPAAAGVIRAGELANETGRVRATYAAANTGLTADEFMRLPGASQMMQAADVDRMVPQLQNMAKTVTAMKELFGQAGLDPNAPMGQILQALEQITQSNFAQRTPAEMERLVRRVQSVADVTGLGVQGVNMMVQHAGTLTDRFGLSRSFAPEIALQSAAMGLAAADTGTFAVSGYGRLDREQYTMVDMQLRASGIASAAGNNAGALRRMYQEGVLQRGRSTEADRLIDQLEAGASVVVDNTTLARVTRDAGISTGTLSAYQQARFENQGALTSEMVNGLRTAQRSESARKYVGGAIERQVSAGLSDAQRAALRGMVGDERAFLLGVSRRAGEITMSSGPEALSDRNLAGTTSNAIRQAMIERFTADGATPAEAARQADAAIAAMGGPGALSQAAGGSMSLLGEQARRNGFASRGAFLQTMAMSPEQMRAENLRARAIGAQASVRSALGGLGQDSIVRRISDAVLGLKDGGTLQEAFNSVLTGDQTPESVRARLGDRGVQTEIEALHAAAQAMGDTGGTPEQQKAFEQQAAKVNALIRGGDYAKSYLAQYGDTLSDAERTTMEEAAALDSPEMTMRGQLEELNREERAAAAADKVSVTFPEALNITITSGVLKIDDSGAQISATATSFPDASMPA